MRIGVGGGRRRAYGASGWAAAPKIWLYVEKTQSERGKGKGKAAQDGWPAWKAGADGGKGKG